MDPIGLHRPKNWKSFGRLALALLVIAVVAAGGGALASMWGQDPGGAYRLAALGVAGAMLFGLIWAASGGMGGKGNSR